MHLIGQGFVQQRLRLILQEDLKEAKRSALFRLLAINGFILGTSAIAGYFLAGKTLKPIKLMLDEQKRFIADASHELRTPLTSLKTEIEVALRNKKIKKETKKILSSNLEDVDKMKNFTDFLLTLSRYEAYGKDIQNEKIDLVHAAKLAVKQNLPVARRSNIEIQEKYDKSVTTTGNPQSMVELISILLNNAIKYNCDKGKVEIMVKNQKGKAIIQVTDYGVGINKKDLPHIFDRFYRSESSRCKQQIDGFGLGLSIAKSIVDLANGNINVKSTPGKGSIFTVTLPV